MIPMLARAPLSRFNTISRRELSRINYLIKNSKPLSGFVAGVDRGGLFVSNLEHRWASTFHVKHAIAVNSATSGLLAASFAAGMGRGDRFLASPFTMSATVAAPMFTGAEPVFVDVEDETFNMSLIEIEACYLPTYSYVVVTNLFGHPARLHRLRTMCDRTGKVLIEDNAQSPFAVEHNRLAGTVGHMGVWSLNVHKHIQCGEGGIVTTDDDDYATKIRRFINHGENMGGEIGLNLRMTETTAAIALAQIERGADIVNRRMAQASLLLESIGRVRGVQPPTVREGCLHAYYTIPFVVEERRREFCDVLRERGVPVVEGYVPPLYRLPAFQAYERTCEVAESLHDKRLFYIENCAWDFSEAQIDAIGQAFRHAAEVL